MKNNQGFTLVELLAVIVILAILVAIAVPSTIAISNHLKEKMYCEKINSIESAASLYGEDRKDSFTETYESYPSKTITVKELVDTGYLKKDQNTSPYIVDPRDSKTEDLYNLSFIVYKKYNRVYVHFNETIKTTCDK